MFGFRGRWLPVPQYNPPYLHPSGPAPGCGQNRQWHLRSFKNASQVWPEEKTSNWCSFQQKRPKCPNMILHISTPLHLHLIVVRTRSDTCAASRTHYRLEAVLMKGSGSSYCTRHWDHITHSGSARGRRAEFWLGSRKMHKERTFFC